LVVSTVTRTRLPSSVSFSYDLNGNLLSDGLKAYAYDDANQLTNVTAAGQWKTDFVYDGLGRRRITRDYTYLPSSNSYLLTNEVHYIYDGMMVQQERDSNNTAQVTYTRGLDLSGGFQGAGGIGGLLARSEGGSHAFYHADTGGNITSLADSSGSVVARYLYDPFGNLLGRWGALAGVNRYQFSSKEVHGPSGTYYYGFRFYEPDLQRWLNQDPIDELGGINVHGFVGNNPVRFVDPYGLEVPAMDSIDANPSIALELELEEQGLTRATANLASRLARSLCRAGRAVKKCERAHHIVAQTDKRAKFARGVLKKFKIGLDEAENGVGLPEKLHQALHTNKYYQAITEAAKTWKTREQAIEGLSKIANELRKLAEGMGAAP
jgi:RHS repeat-associated protein